jgi:hypothetical protein
MKTLRGMAALMMVLLAGSVRSGEMPCGQCGCGHAVRKVCRLVPTVKVTTRTTWCVKCGDICVPGPSTKCGVQCVPDCQARHGVRKEIVWKPSCGCIFPTRTPEKHVEKIEKPGYKCVVEIVCCQCGQAHDDGPATEAAQTYVDALPAAELKKLSERLAATGDEESRLPLEALQTSAEMPLEDNGDETAQARPQPSTASTPFKLFRLFK